MAEVRYAWVREGPGPGEFEITFSDDPELAPALSPPQHVWTAQLRAKGGLLLPPVEVKIFCACQLKTDTDRDRVQAAVQDAMRYPNRPDPW